MASDLALATSSLLNPFASATAASQLSGFSDQLTVANAASMLPVLGKTASLVGGSRVSLGAADASSGPSVLSPTALEGHAQRLAAASGHLPGWCLFVYNLAPEVEESVIWKLFGPFGAVQQVNLVKDSQTNKCRGFAFVTMSDYNQALLAIQSLNGYTLANRVLQVSFKTQGKVRKTMQ